MKQMYFLQMSSGTDEKGQIENRHVTLLVTGEADVEAFYDWIRSEVMKANFEGSRKFVVMNCQLIK